MRLLSASAQCYVRRSLQRTHLQSFRIRSNFPRRQISTGTDTSKSSLAKDVATKSRAVPSAPESPASTPSTPPKLHSSILTTLLVPLRAYGRIQQQRPYITQVASAIVIYILGDLSAQKLSAYGNNTTFLASYDPFKTLRAMIIGAVVSLPVYHWFLFLGTPRFNVSLPSSFLSFLTRRFTSSSATSSQAAATSTIPQRANAIASLTNRVVTNQLVFTPFFLSYFFTAHALLTPLVCASPSLAALPGPGEVGAKLAETVPRGFVNSWKVWPAVTAISFTFVAPQYRAVFAGGVAIGWQTYLGLLNLRAAKAQDVGGGDKVQEVAEMRKDGTQKPVPMKPMTEENDERAAQREGRIALAA
ncbi:MAG: hypothetical protein M1821_008763 [Bathelium mastoideum]|nr:MAG: hypothetical protein M1821_008763 [Bathelium mastoideum]